MALGSVEVHDAAHLAAFVVFAEPDIVFGAQIGGIAGTDGITVSEDLIEEAADDQNQRPQGLRVKGRRFSMKSFSCRLSRTADMPHSSRSRLGLRLKREVHRPFLWVEIGRARRRAFPARKTGEETLPFSNAL